LTATPTTSAAAAAVVIAGTGIIPTPAVDGSVIISRATRQREPIIDGTAAIDAATVAATVVVAYAYNNNQLFADRVFTFPTA